MSFVSKRRRTSTGSTGHRRLARFVTQGVGAAAGFYTGALPGAYQGAAKAGEVFDVASGIMYPEPTIEDAADNVHRTEVYPKNKMGQATYKGYFKRASYKTKTIEGEYASRGYVQKRESFGTVSDPHCLYIGHTTYDPAMIGGTIAAALIRKVLAKAGITLNSRYEELPLAGITNSRGFKIDFHTITQAGVTTLVDSYVFADDATLTTVITAMPDLAQFFINCLLGDNTEMDEKPYALLLYQQDRYQNDPVLDEARLAAKLDLGEEIISMKIMSYMTIQNRTQGTFETGGTFNVERSDVQPLKGRLYEFKNADWRLRIVNVPQSLLNHVPVDRAVMVRSAQLGADFQDVVPPNYFQNCVKSGLVKMQPGNMKRMAINYKFNGLLVNMLVKMRAASNFIVGGVNYASRVPGQMQVIGFEEEMRTISAQSIDCAYERQYVVGVSFRTRKPAPLKVGLAAVGPQNNTA